MLAVIALFATTTHATAQEEVSVGDGAGVGRDGPPIPEVGIEKMPAARTSRPGGHMGHLPPEVPFTDESLDTYNALLGTAAVDQVIHSITFDADGEITEVVYDATEPSAEALVREAVGPDIAIFASDVVPRSTQSGVRDRDNDTYGHFNGASIRDSMVGGAQAACTSGVTLTNGTHKTASTAGHCVLDQVNQDGQYWWWSPGWIEYHGNTPATAVSFVDTVWIISGNETYDEAVYHGGTTTGSYDPVTDAWDYAPFGTYVCVSGAKSGSVCSYRKKAVRYINEGHWEFFVDVFEHDGSRKCQAELIKGDSGGAVYRRVYLGGGIYTAEVYGNYVANQPWITNDCLPGVQRWEIEVARNDEINLIYPWAYVSDGSGGPASSW